MGHTNSTANLGLPQFIGTDKPTWLSDVNGAFAAIDTYAGNNDAALAITDAKADTAIGDAASAVTTAGNAATTAGNAAATATAANTVAGNALTVANGINSKVGVLTDLTTTDKSTVVNAINEVNGKDAGDIAYDNTGSGLTATNVQAAIDEVAQGGGGSGMSYDILYTNPDDTQAMAAGSVASLSDQPTYAFFLIFSKVKNNAACYTSVSGTAGDLRLYIPGPDVMDYRDVTITQTAGTISITATDNTHTATGGSTTVDNTLNIVSKVIGIK